MVRMRFFIVFFIALALTPILAHAQTSLDLRGGVTYPGGSMIPGHDSAACDSSIEGAIRYNSASSCAEFCDGTDWVCPNSADGCTAPSSCPNVGDVCSDGSLFAGFMIYSNSSCEALYVTDNNQSTSSQWKTLNGYNDITDPADKNDAVDGQYNRDNRGGGTFPAFELCENNTYHGKSDWYLPARAELNLLWLNQAAIDANAAGNFTTSFYWSSTENDANYVWYQNFGSSVQDTNFKTGQFDIRCVRRD